MAITRQQQQHLTERVSNTRRYAKSKVPNPPSKYGLDDDLPDGAPPAVVQAFQQKKAAQKIIDKWVKDCGKKYEREVSRIDKEAQDVLDLLLFGDPQKALAATQAFEKKYAPKD